MLGKYMLLGLLVSLYGSVRAWIGPTEGFGDIVLSGVLIIPVVVLVIWIERSARREGAIWKEYQ